MSVQTQCASCIHWWVNPRPNEAKMGRCRLHPPDANEGTLPYTAHDECCGDGQYISDKMNTAGSSRLYDITGNVVGFIHRIPEEE